MTSPQRSSDDDPVVLIAGDSLADTGTSLLQQANLSMVFSGSNTDKSHLISLLETSRAEAIILRHGDIDADVLDASARLRVIANHGAGHDTIDLAAATQHNIPVFVAYGRNARSVAEHALTMILALHKQLLVHHDLMRRSVWRGDLPNVTEFSGKTLGIIGFGPTGRELARLAQPFDTRVIVHDPFVDQANVPHGVRFASLQELVRESDVISLHVPLTESTRGFVDHTFLQSMKQKSLLINTSRGPVVDETALRHALLNGPLAGAGIDTFDEEPPPIDNALLSLSNVVLSPHIAGVTAECLERMSLATAENVVSIIRQREINYEDLLNPEVLDES